MVRSVDRVGLFPRFLRVVRGLAVVLIGACAIAAPSADAETQTAKIAVALSLTGAGASIGKPDLEGARLAVEEANAEGVAPAIELSVYDDASDVEEGKRLARQIGAGNALVALGPGTTAMALTMGPIFSDAGIVAIGATTTGDRVTDPPNFFRAVFSTSDGGEILAGYVKFDLGLRRAIVLFKDDSYGHAVTDGFKRAADWLGLDAEYRSYSNVEEAKVAAGLAAAEPGNPAIIIAAYDADTAPVLMELKRQGASGPILGSITMAGDRYNSFFVDQPEERQTLGFFTEGGLRRGAGGVRQRQRRDPRLRRSFSRTLRP
ncbi:MAG: ABC transporter substrate-binding protein [Roseiarcus sp.]